MAIQLDEEGTRELQDQINKILATSFGEIILIEEKIFDANEKVLFQAPDHPFLIGIYQGSIVGDEHDPEFFSYNDEVMLTHPILSKRVKIAIEEIHKIPTLKISKEDSKDLEEKLSVAIPGIYNVGTTVYSGPEEIREFLAGLRENKRFFPSSYDYLKGFVEQYMELYRE